MMNVSTKGIALIKQFEGFRANSYLDSVNVPTIGYGSTMWQDGRKVKLGETITIDEADKLLLWETGNKSKPIKNLDVNQNQFDALVSFAYNLGIGALLKSTLLKKVKANANDPLIKKEFMRWVNAGGKPLPGLIKRRKLESELYFTPSV